jgi:hypothetical protein
LATRHRLGRAAQQETKMKNPTQRTRPAILAAIALFLAAAPGVYAQERWFHVRVTEGGSKPTTVAVNLPLSLVEAALQLIPEHVQHEIDMELNDVDFEIEDLRKFWEEVRDVEDATFVTVESPEETVKIAKEGELLVARTTERTAEGARVDVRFPFAVLDALFQGTGEHEVDLVGAARALAEYGDGDIVTVDDGATRVRVWVDDANEGAE